MNKIDFDNVLLANKNDIYERCLDPHDAEAIFQFMVTGNKVLGDSPNIYFFIDAATYLVIDECAFLNNGLIDISDLSNGRKFLFFLRANIFEVLVNILGSIINFQTKVIEMKLTGTFKTKPPYGYEKNKNKFRIVTTDSSYVGGVKIQEGVSFTILREYLDIDGTTGELFPLSSYSYKDVDTVPHHSYFIDSNIDAYIEHYHGGYDGSRFRETLPTAFYEAGMKITKQFKTAKEDAKPSFNKTTEETYQLIVAALIAVLRNTERPCFDSQEAIYRHLEKYFPEVKGLSASNLRKLIPEAKKVLFDKEDDAQLEGKYKERFDQTKI